MENNKKTMDQIVALCKNRGFIFPGSDIYGGLANSWDYGPLGVELKNNVKRAQTVSGDKKQSVAEIVDVTDLAAIDHRHTVDRGFEQCAVFVVTHFITR